MITYSTFNFPGTIPESHNLLTGIRRKDSNLYITGFYIPQGKTETVSYLYKGNIKHLNSGGYYILNYPGSATTNLYGPAILKHDKVRVVGNYTLTGTNNTYGCMYTGKLDGTGRWITLTPSYDTLNCIAHSTMKDLVVGGYQTNHLLKAFIYDIKRKSFIEIHKANAKSITAYGVWYNGGDCYTICGGYSPIVGIQLNIGFIVDYNRKTKKFSDWTDYYYNNDKESFVTHFDGITGAHDGYHLTGTTTSNNNEIGFFTRVKRKSNHHLEKKASWLPLSYPNAITTTGNSIVDDIVIGVYSLPDDPAVNGYISRIHEHK